VLDQKCFAISRDGTGEQFVIQSDSHGWFPRRNGRGSHCLSVIKWMEKGGFYICEWSAYAL